MTHELPSLGMRPVRDFLQHLAGRNMRVHSLIAHQAGRTVLDLWQWPHDPQLKHRTHSATKSFTVAAVAFAEAEGLLGLEDPVSRFFPGRPPGPTDELFRTMRVSDLLTMRTGHGRGLSGATTRLLRTGWAEEFLQEPLVEEPGHNFTYSSTTSHVLSAIVQHVTGEPVDVYLRPRLFDPLGITDYVWERDPAGVSSGGNGLSLRPRDLLAFGVLHLQDGLWDGRRVLPAGWTQRASALHVARAVSGDWNGKELVPPAPDAIADSGYGYQFWTTADGIYSASGIFGQECMVFPRHQGAVVITGAMGDGSYHDLPGLLREAFRSAFSGPGPDAAAEAEAATEVEHLLLAARTPEQPDPTPRHAGFRGTYDVEPGEHGLRSLTVEARADSVLLVVEDDRGSHALEHGLGGWVQQRTGVSVWRLHHTYQEDDAQVLAGAEWTDGDPAAPDVLRLTWHFLEAPFIDHLTLRFGAGDVTVEHTVNVNSGPTALPVARGVRRPGETRGA